MLRKWGEIEHGRGVRGKEENKGQGKEKEKEIMKDGEIKRMRRKIKKVEHR